MLLLLLMRNKGSFAVRSSATAETYHKHHLRATGNFLNVSGIANILIVSVLSLLPSIMTGLSHTGYIRIFPCRCCNFCRYTKNGAI